MADENSQAGTQAKTAVPAAADQQTAAPVPQAGGAIQNVPQPTSMIRPPATAEETRPAPPGDDTNAAARIRALRQEADKLEAGLHGPATVKVKVELPHSELHFGGLFVDNEFTPVPLERLASLQQAAENAQVTLTVEG